MKAIVTGGAGFIGSHIAERLLKMGAKVIIIDDLSAGKVENIPAKAKFIEADICNNYFLKEFDKVDVIFHNAASKKNICLNNPHRDLEVNGGGTLRLLQLSKKFGVKKFVYASTGSVYGIVNNEITEQSATHPVSFYGISKLAAENYVNYFNRVYFLNTTVLRYFHVYGSRQDADSERGGVVAIFKKLVKEGKPITIHGSGNQQRVFTHVDDIVEANIRVAENRDAHGHIYNCAANKQVTISELAVSLGAKEIEYANALEGDIFKFNVNANKIQRLGVEFRDYGS